MRYERGVIHLFPVGLGLLLVVFACVMWSGNARFVRESEAAPGVIVDFTYEDPGDDEEPSTYPIIRYTVDGDVYENRVGYYESGMQIGDSITVYHPPGDPNAIAVKHSPVLYIVFLVLGAAAVMVGCAGGFRARRQRRARADAATSVSER